MLPTVVAAARSCLLPEPGIHYCRAFSCAALERRSRQNTFDTVDTGIGLGIAARTHCLELLLPVLIHCWGAAAAAVVMLPDC